MFAAIVHEFVLEKYYPLTVNEFESADVVCFTRLISPRPIPGPSLHLEGADDRTPTKLSFPIHGHPSHPTRLPCDKILIRDTCHFQFTWKIILRPSRIYERNTCTERLQHSALCNLIKRGEKKPNTFVKRIAMSVFHTTKFLCVGHNANRFQINTERDRESFPYVSSTTKINGDLATVT